DALETVVLVVVQPNGEGEAVQEWSIPARELRLWGVEVLRPAAARTDDQNAPLCASEKGCRWCRAKSGCPEMQNYMGQIARVKFLNPELPRLEDMTPAQQEQVASALDMMVAWGKELKAYMTDQAQQGLTTYPNFKLVAARANRKWTAEAETQLSGILGEAAFKRKLKGLGDVTKMLKARNLDPASVMGGITEKPDNGLTLVARTDKRKEISVQANTAMLGMADVFC
ncbi:DUF2800 domain-containing protein, partial [bacterium]|nr:DUF2800 domain-containing protein [bacterium]